MEGVLGLDRAFELEPGIALEALDDRLDDLPAARIDPLEECSELLL